MYRDNIVFVEDYSVLSLNNKNILCVGGATSLDRLGRTEGEDYWKEEKFVLKEKLLEETKDITVVVTHNAPTFCYPLEWSLTVYNFADKDPSLYRTLPAERDLIKNMYEILTTNNQIEKWYYGHYHQSNVETISETDFILLGINEFKELR